MPLIYVVMNGNDIVTAFLDQGEANDFIKGTTFDVKSVLVQDMQSFPDHA